MLKFAENVYLFEVRKWGFSKSQGGTVAFNLEGYPVGIPKDSFDLDKGFDEIEGRTARVITEYLTPKTAAMFRDKMLDNPDLGWDGKDIGQLDPDAEGALDLTGKTVLAQCSHDTYKGKTREKWQITRKLARRVLSKSDRADVAKKYNQLFEEVAREKAKTQQDPTGFDYGANKGKKKQPA